MSTKKINIYGVANGVGLEKDFNILSNLLIDYDVFFIDMEIKKTKTRQAHIGIFLEKIVEEYMDLNQINILIPNPEWYYWGAKILKRFDLILAKTKDCEKIYKQFTDKVVFTSFTSEDHYNKGIKKERRYIHAAGKSETKGSETIWKLWVRNQNLPQLIFCRINHFDKYFQNPKNILKCFFKFKEDEFRILQNACFFHLCPSEYEGWGHYIHEAKSMGAILITTNAAPMNTFVTTEEGFLVDVHTRERRNYGILNKISSESLLHAIMKTVQLTDNELSIMSEKSRQSFVDNDKYFRYRFLEVIKNL